MSDLIDRAEAQTEIQFAARRYTVAHEAHGEGKVVWSDSLISVADAMNALRKVPSAQTCTTTDTISRQAAIDAMCGVCSDWCDEGVCKKVSALQKLPPAQQWISCSERLPEDGENVLVTYKTTDKIHPCQYHDDGSRNPWYSYIDQCRAHMNVVLAWMPLPEPYQEERREDG